MGKLTKKKMKRIAAEIRSNPSLARARIQQIADELGYTDDETAERAFLSFLAVFADDWVKDLHLLSERGGHLPRLLVFAPSPETPDKPWRLERINGGVFWQEGPVTLESLRLRMTQHILSVAPENGLAVWVLATDAATNPHSPGSVAFLQHASGTYMIALFRRNSWTRHALDEPLKEWFTAILTGMNQLQLEAAQKHAREVLGIEQPDTDGLEDAGCNDGEASQVPNSHLGEFGDGLLGTLTSVLEELREVEAQHAKVLAEAVAQANERANAAHTEELARRQRSAVAERESEARITAGLRARIARLEDELKALRKQAKAPPVKSAREESVADPLGAALDRMFA